MKIIGQSIQTEQEMQNLAALVARFCFAGDVILLKGTLGMGKSTFARAFIQALAGKEITVPSPTFTLVQTYNETRLNVAHVDAYRLQTADDFDGLDLFDYFDHGITLIEWPENVEEALPKSQALASHMMESEKGDVLTLEIKAGLAGENSRELVLSAAGSWVNRFGLMFKEKAEHLRMATAENRLAFLKRIGLENAKIENVNGALSCRTYYRIETAKGSRILMDAPPPMENVKPFLKVLDIYKAAGVHVPFIDEKDEEQGYLLMEDFGGTPLSAVTNEAEQKAWLKACADMLVGIYHKAQKDEIPVYGEKAMFNEASRYVDWYLPYETGHAVPLEDRAQFARIWQNLLPLAMNVPQTVSHWDFHSDNLMKIENIPCVQNIGVLDFQDAHKAPITFDLACLLEDRWQKPLSAELKAEIISYMVEKLEGEVTLQAFMESYNVVMLHRMLKITGLYNRASKRDGRQDLPWDMEKVWHAIHQTLEAPYLAELKAFMQKQQNKEVRAAS